jgi:hypothetical protein
MMRVGKMLVILSVWCVAPIITTITPLPWGVVGQNVSVVSQALATHPYSEARSRNGNGYSDSIAELRIYRTDDRNFRWYELSELEQQQLVFRTRDKRIIADILRAANMGPEPGEHGYCYRRLMDYRLHVVTLEQGEKLFGYFQVSPMEAVKDAPADFGTCASITFSDQNLWGWTSYEFFGELKALGITVH